ncbi:RNA-binding protein Nova-1 [Klebsormidium nitens]|uniref:RNA-binding protein Nova-1 n=1 Tax=Klebsormidium nitens TaxID=105231 RepID=A0A1Y1HYQ8_KLENI|nr:RNA-binding protein Nova-1 [Klebsormidium nitens]|eukprot:GAQ83784.1 RNA-binding protein Nova-1 [Klebsormidium nitens]
MIDSGAGHSSPPPKEGDAGSLNGQLDSPLNRVAGLTLNSSPNLTALLQEHEQKEQAGSSERMKRSPEKEEGLREEEHASPTKKRNLQVDTDNASDTPSSVRFLISNASAGSIIGKGGSTISEFQLQSGARIQLSRNREFFPGTTDRIILLSGTINAILTALHLILSKIMTEEAGGGDISQKTSQVKLIVPNAVCGGIIGKGGATIRAYVEDSAANIKLSGQDQAVPGVTDRIVTITGKLEQQMRAVALILAKMTEDPNYMLYSNMPLSYSVYTPVGMPHGPMPLHGFPMGPGQGMPFQQHPILPPQHMAQLAGMIPGGPPTHAITVAVPDEHVGAIVGRGGRTITEIQQMAGVRIKISDRGDFVMGTTNRKITITGPLEGTQIAQYLLSQKVHQNATEYGHGHMQ